MKVTYAGQTYDCTKAIRQGDNATLHLTSGDSLEFIGVSEIAWSKFHLEDGEWETEKQSPSDSDRLDALEAAMLAIMGV